MTTLYITAAPIGAVPKFLDPLEATFIPAFLLEGFFDAGQRAKILADLKADGWEVVPAGGLLLQSGHAFPIAESLLPGGAQGDSLRQALSQAHWSPRDGAWHPRRLRIKMPRESPSNGWPMFPINWRGASYCN